MSGNVDQRCFHAWHVELLIDRAIVDLRLDACCVLRAWFAVMSILLIECQLAAIFAIGIFEFFTSNAWGFGLVPPDGTLGPIWTVYLSYREHAIQYLKIVKFVDYRVLLKLHIPLLFDHVVQHGVHFMGRLYIAIFAAIAESNWSDSAIWQSSFRVTSDSFFMSIRHDGASSQLKGRAYTICMKPNGRLAKHICIALWHACILCGRRPQEFYAPRFTSNVANWTMSTVQAQCMLNDSGCIWLGVEPKLRVSER